MANVRNHRVDQGGGGLDAGWLAHAFALPLPLLLKLQALCHRSDPSFKLIPGSKTATECEAVAALLEVDWTNHTKPPCELATVHAGTPARR